MFMNKEVADIFRYVDPEDNEQLNLVVVSLDSVTDEANDVNRRTGAAKNAKDFIKILNNTDRVVPVPFRINITAVRSVIPHLFATYEFAQDSGAQEVLVHIPSEEGSGYRFSKDRERAGRPRVKANEILGMQALGEEGLSEWYDDVFYWARWYNARYIRNKGFKVVCQLGNAPVSSCDMLAGESSLMFVRPLNDVVDRDDDEEIEYDALVEGPDVPAPACAISLPKAATQSAYILRGLNLYARISKDSEAYRAQQVDPNTHHYCPLTNPDDCRGCIYVDSKRWEATRLDGLAEALMKMFSEKN